MCHIHGKENILIGYTKLQHSHRGKEGNATNVCVCLFDARSPGPYASFVDFSKDMNTP